MGKSWDQYRLGEPYEAPRRKGLKTLAIVATLMAITILPAMAAKGGSGSTGGGGKGHGGGGSTSGSGSITMKLVTDVNSNNLPNYGDQVTFNVSTTATSEPYVRLDCYEGGVWVLSTSAGFFDSYPWPWTRTFTLSWDMWHTKGAESDCTATLYNGGVTYGTTKFHVYA